MTQSIQLRADGRAIYRRQPSIPLQQFRRKPAPRSSWPLVGLAVLIVIFAIKGLNL